MVQDYTPMMDFGIGFMLIFIALIAFFFCMRFIIPRRSKLYREDLVNLYVAGRIRQIATEDKINLDEEYEIFKKWVKKRNLEDKSLDNSVETELQDKLSEPKEQPKTNLSEKKDEKK